jgi:flagellar protein FlbT
VTGLVLKLRPFEKLLVNGAILQNGSRATRLRVRSANASILRLRDAMPPSRARTLLERIYFVAQLAVAGEADSDQAKDELLALIDAASIEAQSETQRQLLSRARMAAEAGKSYSVMRSIRPLIDYQGETASGGS